jgi:hypothetical protein
VKRVAFLRAVLLFLLGMAGVLSILTMELPLPEDARAILLTLFSEEQLRWVVLINPTMLLVLAIVAGSLCRETTRLQTPLLDRLLGVGSDRAWVRPTLAGIGAGLTGGSLLVLLSALYKPYLPEAFASLSDSMAPGVWVRMLYGGITEEILMRYGLMSLLVWVGIKAGLPVRTPVYLLAIVLSSLLFALGHFPIVYMAVPEPPMPLLTYILIGNTLGGLIFGWLFWKMGLESAILAHMAAHAAMLALG